MQKAFRIMKSLFLVIGAFMLVTVGESWAEFDYEEQNTLDESEGASRDTRLSGDLLGFLNYDERSYRLRRQDGDEDYEDDNQRDTRLIGSLLYNADNYRGDEFFRRRRQPKPQTQGSLKEPSHVLAVGQKCFRDGRMGFCKNSICCCQPGKANGICMAVSDLSTDKWCWKSY